MPGEPAARLISSPLWWEDFPAFADAAPALPERADVVVVGAGLTGCSAALTLARAGQKVLLLDAERPGFGASTRNGGMVGGGYRLSPEEMDAKYGVETAQALLEESHVHSLAFTNRRIREEGIECDYRTTGRFRGLWNREDYDATARGLEALRRRVPVNIDMVPPEAQGREIGSRLYSGGMLLHDHGGLHPGRYLAGMLQAAHRAGAEVLGQTLVEGVAARRGGFDVATSRGMVRADAVLMATNGYTRRAFGALKRRIIPLPSFLIATEDLPEGLADEIMPTRRMYVESRLRHCYFRLSPDGKRFVLGARAAMSPILPERAAKVLRGLMCEIFPQMQRLRVTHSWTGTTGFSFSFLPHVGRIGGIWHALGYSGSGNAMAPYLGHKAALQMLGDRAGETAFSRTRLETRLWYRKTPWFLPLAHQLYRFADRRQDRQRGR